MTRPNLQRCFPHQLTAKHNDHKVGDLLDPRDNTQTKEKNNTLDDVVDIVIALPSFNRFEMVHNIIHSLTSCSDDLKTKIILHDDCSDDPRYINTFSSYKNSVLRYMRTDKNLGKAGYWQSITNIMNMSKSFEYKYMLFIADDIEICSNFLCRVIAIHELAKHDDKSIICTSYGHIRTTKHWGLSQWVDGLCMFDKRFIEQIDYKIDPIKNITEKSTGSGVWKQISQKINQFEYKVFKPKQSYVTHLGHTDSRMHPVHRKQNPYYITNTVD